MSVLKFNKLDKVIEVHSLEELLGVLLKTKQEKIDSAMKENISRIMEWVKEAYPDKIHTIKSLESSHKEFTYQQMYEELVRELRKLVSVSK